MKKALALYLFLLFTTISTAQNVQWAKALVTNSSEVKNMVVDDSGNVYSVGRFFGKVDFDPGEDSFILNSEGVNMGFILKLNTNGEFVWAKNIGKKGTFPNEYHLASNITIDPFGKIIISGFFLGIIELNFAAPPHYLNSPINIQNLFVIKIEPNGELIWAKQTHSAPNGNCASIGLATDKHGSVFVSGNFDKSINFNNDSLNEFVLTSIGLNNNIFILKLNSNGSFEWAKRYATGGLVYFRAISFDPQGSLVLLGQYRGSTDFNPNFGEIRTSPAGSVFVLKVDLDGVFQWVKTLPLYNNNYLRIDINHKGEIYIGAHFSGSINLDPGVSNYTLSNSAYTYFVVKYHQDGSFVWAKQFTSSIDLYCYHLHIDTLNNINFIGVFSNTVDFDFGANTHYLTSNGGNDFFVAQYDSLGEYKWAKGIGGKGNEFTSASLMSPNGKIYVAGSFSDTVEFSKGDSNKTLIAKGNQNIFICKFANCKDAFVSKDTVIICSGSSFWVGNKEHSVSGDFLDTFTSYQGCDSIVYTHLIVLPPPDTLIDVTICAGQSYSIANNEYWESGTFVDTIKTTEGCDSIVTTNITVTPAPEFILPVFLCEGETYNFNGRILNSEGRYTDTLSTTEGCDSLSIVEISFYPPIVARIEERLPILRALPSGANYQWYDCNNNFTPVEGADSQDFHPPYNGLFAVRVTRGECEEISECLPYFKQYGIYMPNSFSPNGDGKNDTYRPVAEGWVVARMTVYNRWGELLFDSQDPQAAWDGTFKGEQVQSGVYIVRVTFNSIETGAAPFRSVTENISVHLVR